MANTWSAVAFGREKHQIYGVPLRKLRQPAVIFTYTPNTRTHAHTHAPNT